MESSHRDLAAVAILVYSRASHFQASVESLLSSPLARFTELYVFSDGPSPGDEEAVQRVRDYSRSIEGFKRVVLHFQETNNFSKNVRDFFEVPLRNHERVILMEDDNVVSSTFLTFMNDALEMYKDDDRISSISAWAPPVGQPKITKQDVYLTRMWSFWTAAVWREKKVFDFLELQEPYADMKKNRLERRVRQVIPDLPRGLEKIDEGIQPAPDRQLTYYLIKHNRFQLRPVQSLVMNTGHDGTGMNSVRSHRFGNPPFEGSIQVTGDFPRYYRTIDKRQYRFMSWRKSWRYKLEKRLRRMRRKIGEFLNR